MSRNKVETVVVYSEQEAKEVYGQVVHVSLKNYGFVKDLFNPKDVYHAFLLGGNYDAVKTFQVLDSWVKRLERFGGTYDNVMRLYREITAIQDIIRTALQNRNKVYILKRQ